MGVGKLSNKMRNWGSRGRRRFILKDEQDYFSEFISEAEALESLLAEAEKERDKFDKRNIEYMKQAISLGKEIFDLKECLRAASELPKKWRLEVLDYEHSERGFCARATAELCANELEVTLRGETED